MVLVQQRESAFGVEAGGASKNARRGIGGVAADDCFWTSFAMGLGCGKGNCERTRLFLEGGKGICNTIYVDNLVNAIQLAIDKPTAAGKTFLVGDEETVTWRDFYAPICQHLKSAEPASVSAREVTPIREFSLVEKVRGISGMQKALPLIPDRLKRAVKGAMSEWSEKEKPSPWRLRQAEPIGLSSEMNALQQCQWRLPHKRAAEELGYRAPVSFEEGIAARWHGSISRDSTLLANDTIANRQDPAWLYACASCGELFSRSRF